MSNDGPKRDPGEVLSEKIGIEMGNWEAMDFHPANVNIDPFLEVIKNRTLQTIIQEKFDMKDEEFNLIFKQKLLDALIETRKEIEPQIRQARVAALATPAGAEKGLKLLGPNGQPISF